MVSSVPFDVLNDPQAAIQELFDQHLQSQSSIEFHSVLSNHFREIFNQEERLELVSSDDNHTTVPLLSDSFTQDSAPSFDILCPEFK